MEKLQRKTGFLRVLLAHRFVVETWRAASLWIFHSIFCKMRLRPELKMYNRIVQRSLIKRSHPAYV